MENKSSKLKIYAADIGAITKNNFAWAKLNREKYDKDKNHDIEKLVNCISSDLKNGEKVALGLECPLIFLK